MSDFGTVDYWERFYRRFVKRDSAGAQEHPSPATAHSSELEPYEWYFGTETLLPRLLACLPPPSLEQHKEEDAARDELRGDEERHRWPELLMLGCGSSTLSEKLYEIGYHDIINVDFSPLVIANMQAKTRDTCPLMQWHVMDVTSMRSLASASIDVAIDKGTLDAIMSSSEWQFNASAMAAEVHRVLRPGGIWVVCSFGDDRAECVDDELDAPDDHDEPSLPEGGATVRSWTARSAKWHVVRERVPIVDPPSPAGEPGSDTAPHDDGDDDNDAAVNHNAASGEEGATDAWYFYVFSKTKQQHSKIT